MVRRFMLLKVMGVEDEQAVSLLIGESGPHSHKLRPTGRSDPVLTQWFKVYRYS